MSESVLGFTADITQILPTVAEVPKTRLVHFLRAQILVLASDWETIVKLILTCLNSDFVTNEFYVPERHSSQLICLYYLWAADTQNSYYS